ncbi:hypothetical protein MRX96_046546 [Rhipicephalus microplus]
MGNGRPSYVSETNTALRRLTTVSNAQQALSANWKSVAATAAEPLENRKMGRRRLQGRLLHQLLLAIYDARLSRNPRGETSRSLSDPAAVWT